MVDTQNLIGDQNSGLYAMSVGLKIILAIVIWFAVMFVVAAVLEVSGTSTGAWPASSGVAAVVVFLWFVRRKTVDGKKGT